MAKGLNKLTWAANTMQTREDWEKLAREAVDLGIAEHIILKCAPLPQDSWKKIDKCTARLRAKIDQARQLATR